MDVHSSNFTLCSFEPGYGFEADKIFGQTQIKEDIFNSTPLSHNSCDRRSSIVEDQEHATKDSWNLSIL